MAATVFSPSLFPLTLEVLPIFKAMGVIAGSLIAGNECLGSQFRVLYITEDQE